MEKAENVRTEENAKNVKTEGKEAKVVDELFFISEVKMKEADIEIIDLEQDLEEDSSEGKIKENDVSEDEKAQEGGTEA